MRKELRRIEQAGVPLIDPNFSERPYTLEQITSDRENAFALWNVNTRSKVHQRAEVKVHQLERGDGLMVLLLAGGARGGSPPRCCCEELIS
jgi:hypothetical protein